jgi:hypothetical protein
VPVDDLLGVIPDLCRGGRAGVRGVVVCAASWAVLGKSMGRLRFAGWPSVYYADAMESSIGRVSRSRGGAWADSYMSTQSDDILRMSTVSDGDVGTYCLGDSTEYALPIRDVLRRVTHAYDVSVGAEPPMCAS